MSKTTKTGPFEKMTNEEIKRTSAILLAVEMASSFQLYSYRIVNHTEFYERCQELVNTFKQSLMYFNDDETTTTD